MRKVDDIIRAFPNLRRVESLIQSESGLSGGELVDARERTSIFLDSLIEGELKMLSMKYGPSDLGEYHVDKVA